MERELAASKGEVERLWAALDEIQTHAESALTCDLSEGVQAAFEQIEEIASGALSQPGKEGQQA